MKNKIRVVGQILSAILIVWFISQGHVLETLWATGMSGQSVSELMKSSLLALLLVTSVLIILVLLINADRVFRAVCATFALLDARGGAAQEDKRLTEYRIHVKSQNLIGSLRVFCGGLGLMVLFFSAILAIVQNTEGGLFAGGVLSVIARFGKCGFFVACLWGLWEPWTHYSDENGKECRLRREMLAQIEQDPHWWRKHDEEQFERDKERAERDKERRELEEKLAAKGYDPDYLTKRAEESATAIGRLTRQIEAGTKTSSSGDTPYPQR